MAIWIWRATLGGSSASALSTPVSASYRPFRSTNSPIGKRLPAMPKAKYAPTSPNCSKAVRRGQWRISNNSLDSASLPQRVDHRSRRQRTVGELPHAAALDDPEQRRMHAACCALGVLEISRSHRQLAQIVFRQRTRFVDPAHQKI